MAKKGPRQTIMLQSSASPHRYYTEKNVRTTTEKVKMKKYDPTVRKHVEYTEGKMK